MSTHNTPTDGPRRLYVESTTRCNLNCAMCMKLARHTDIPEKDMGMDVFERLVPVMGGLERMMLNGVGEPLMNRRLPEMVRLARAHMPPEGNIGFQTNGLLLTQKLADDLLCAGLDRVCLSVDTVTPAAERELHCGGTASRLERAFEMLRSAAHRAERTSFRLGVEFVLMRDNYHELPEIIEWAARQGASFALVSHVLSYHPDTASQDMFNPNTGRAIELFEGLKAEARRRGLDLKKYPTEPWKWTKTDEERELVALVERFMADAQKQGVMVHLPRLMEWDEKDLSGLERVYERAGAVAREQGIELDLPPLHALSERSCSFVENGTMFVTPEGDVRPCYFLWHRYSCHLDAMNKRVEPLTFGNVLESNPGDIWRSPEYAAFRGRVLEYDYPFCTNCAFTPCPDLLGENGPFEEDCYGVKVPCGHCVWCMGGVRCMD